MIGDFTSFGLRSFLFQFLAHKNWLHGKADLLTEITHLPFDRIS